MLSLVRKTEHIMAISFTWYMFISSNNQMQTVIYARFNILTASVKTVSKTFAPPPLSVCSHLMFSLSCLDCKVFSVEFATLFSVCAVSRRMVPGKCLLALEFLEKKKKDHFAQSEFIQIQLCHCPLWKLCLIRTAIFGPVRISVLITLF